MLCPGHEVARHLDSLGCTVFAGCLNTASEVSTQYIASNIQPEYNPSSCAQGAQRLRVEASSRLQLLSLDVPQVVMFILT